MIARFQVLLPTAIDRPAPAEPVATDVIVDGYSVRIWSPMQTLMSAQDLDGRSEVPLFSAMQGIRPNPEPRVSTTVEIDGTPTVLSNLLVIDFMKPEFDRAPADLTGSVQAVGRGRRASTKRLNAAPITASTAVTAR